MPEVVINVLHMYLKNGAQKTARDVEQMAM